MHLFIFLIFFITYPNLTSIKKYKEKSNGTTISQYCQQQQKNLTKSLMLKNHISLHKKYLSATSTRMG
jgi:hypothetical protein